MSPRYPNAQAWATDHSLANVPRLARLEGFAFQRHQEIVATFGEDGAAMARFTQTHQRSPARSSKNVLVVIVGLIVALAPIVGVAVYGDAPAYVAPTAEPLSADVAVAIAGVCFVISAVTQLVAWILWLRRGATWSPALLGLALVAAVMASFASIGIPNVSARDGYAGADLWLLPVWATLVLAVPLALGVLVRHKIRTEVPVVEEKAPLPTVSDRERARLLVSRLPAAERHGLQADRDGALRILAERGLLDDETLQAALAADLGTLFTLDPIPAP